MACNNDLFWPNLFKDLYVEYSFLVLLDSSRGDGAFSSKAFYFFQSETVENVSIFIHMSAVFPMCCMFPSGRNLFIHVTSHIYLEVKCVNFIEFGHCEIR